MAKGAIQSNHGRLGVKTGFVRGLRPQKRQKEGRRTACFWTRLDKLASPVVTVCL